MPTITRPTKTAGAVTVELRPIEPADGDECARIVYEAFGAIDDHYRFERDFPSLEAAEQLTSAFIAHPSVWGVVAEREGQILGSNFVDERGPIRGLGPITVDPLAQGAGVGRRLMEAALERSQGARGIRLFQDSFNVGSLSLYASLGFEVKESVVVISGKPRSEPVGGGEVRPITEDDLEHCEALCKKVHGFERTNELRDAMQAFAPFVAIREGRITAYASNVTFWPMAHGVAESDEDMKALLLGAAAAVEEPIAFLVPIRSGLFRWCLAEGLRLVKPMNLMAVGEYHEPSGSWFPNVLY